MLSAWRIYFLNVGDGDCIYLEDSARSNNMLIDGGRPASGVVDFLRANQVDSISLVISTHCHEDHAGGLIDVIDWAAVGEFWCPYPVDKMEFRTEDNSASTWSREARLGARALATYQRLLARIADAGIRSRTVGAGDFIHKGEMTLRVAYPPAAEIAAFRAGLELLRRRPDAGGYERVMRAINATSLFLTLQLGDCIIHLPADPPAEKIVVDHLQRCKLLKLSHHGCADGVSEHLLTTTRPADVVISAARDSHEFPSPATLAMLAQMRRRGLNFTLHRTDTEERLPYLMFNISAEGCIRE